MELEASHARIARLAKAEMMRDLSDPKTIPALAKACGVSPTTLKDAFRRTYGVPIYSWYRDYRVRRASEMLLADDRTVAQVAAEVGYSNPSKFAKAFSTCLGMTPHEWRSSGSMPADGLPA